MIGVELNGRLGNQMFQYAFATFLASKLNTRFFIDETRYRFLVGKYFTLTSRRRKHALAVRLRKLTGPPLRSIEYDSWQPPEVNLEQAEDDAVYSGYFQSEKYFADAEAAVRDEFAIKRKYRKLFEDKYGRTFSERKVLVVHVRRTDYRSFGVSALGDGDISLPNEYYFNCLRCVQDLDGYLKLLISDDPESARRDFGSSFEYETNSEIVDFQLMLNADCLILANSSFAWWAGFLNRSAQAIYAPEYWVGFQVRKEYPVGVTSERFTTVPVY